MILEFQTALIIKHHAPKNGYVKNYVEIYIRDNKDLFHSFYEHKDEIEQIIGGKLDWRELPDKMASRIVIACPTKIKDESKRKEQFDWMIQTAIKFYKAFKKFE